MSRSCITDKSSPPKSEWFGFKYRVTPESSKLLQEAVFKDGGGWCYTRGKNLAHIDEPFLIVREGEITFSDDEHYFETCVFLPEKQPPQPVKVAPQAKKEGEPKELKVGKYYKCVDDEDTTVLQKGKYYQCDNLNLNENGCIRITSDCGSLVMLASRFDINSESDYAPNDVNAGFEIGKAYKFRDSCVAHMTTGNYYLLESFSKDGKNLFGCRDDRGNFNFYTKARFEVKDFKESVDIDVEESRIDNIVQVTVERDRFFSIDDVSAVIKHFNQPEDVNIMSTQNRVVSVKFFDDDAGLKAENSLVASYEITTRANDAMTVNKLLMREDIAGDIDLHNAVRASTVDATILKNTGNKVFLQPIDFEDLRVEVRQV